MRLAAIGLAAGAPTRSLAAAVRGLAPARGTVACRAGHRGGSAVGRAGGRPFEVAILLGDDAPGAVVDTAPRVAASLAVTAH